MIIKLAIALAVVLIVAAFAAWAFLPARHLPGNRARHLRIRLHLRLHPGKGFAHAFSLHLRWSRFAVLRRSGRIRPALPLRYRFLDPREHSVFLGRAHYRHGLRVPLEEHLLVMAPPRTFKTAFLADVILRYPGPVIATSTKPDVYALTSAVRAQLGPVHVFNPQHIGGVPSTFCWSPVDGCEDPATAIRRADAFAFAVSQKGVEDGTFWSAKASDYLRGYFHAAALAGYDLRAVAAWVSGADPHIPEQILAAAGARQWAYTLAELRGEAHKTAATVRMVMSRALAFMADPDLAASVLPAPGTGFNIPAFLRDAGTVYMVAEAVSEDAPVAPLFAAMASEIHWIAAQIGQASPSGAARSAALDGPGRGDPDLPGPAAVLAVGFRRQGHPGRRRRARRGPARRAVGRARPPGRPGHLLGEGVPARHHRRHHAAGGEHAVRAGVVEGPRPGPRHPPRRGHPGHDPPAARRVRPGHPRRLRPGHRPAAPRLAQPRLPPRPPPGPRPGRARPGQRPVHPRSRARRADPRRGHRPALEPDMTDDQITAALDQLAAQREQITRLDTREATHYATLTGLLAGLTARTGPDPARTTPAATSPTRPRAGGSSARMTGSEPVARLRGLGGPGLPARLRPPGRRPRPLLARPRPVPVRPGHRLRPVVGPVPAARPRPRAAVRPGRIPGPHPARPGRPADDRDHPLRPHPPPEHAMTDDQPCARPWPTPAAAGPCSPASPARRSPPPGTATRDATTDEQQITGWFGRHPGRNVAIATGAPGPDVLDIDVHGPAGNGYAALGRLHCAGLLEGAYGYVRTPSGGLHIYFTGTAQHCGHLAAHHVDFRSAGGYVLAPPSQVDGHPYLPWGTPGRDGTLSWERACRALPSQPQRQRPGPRPAPGRDLGTLARWLTRQPEGNRNAGLYWAANRALEADPAADLSPLAEAARQAGLGDQEITRTLDSARRTGQARPEPPGYQAEAVS